MAYDPTIAARIPKDARDAIRQFATDEQIRMSDAIRQVIEAGLKQLDRWPLSENEKSK